MSRYTLSTEIPTAYAKILKTAIIVGRVFKVLLSQDMGGEEISIPYAQEVR